MRVFGYTSTRVLRGDACDLVFLMFIKCKLIMSAVRILDALDTFKIYIISLLILVEINYINLFYFFILFYQ